MQWIEDCYFNILEQLKANQRAQHHFNAQQTKDLLESFKKALDKKDALALERLLCLVDHSHRAIETLPSQLIELLRSSWVSSEHKIFALWACSKHLIQPYRQQNLRLPPPFFEILGELLKSSPAEVVEWTLRLVDEIGDEAKILYPLIQKIRPNIWSNFNPQKKQIRQLIQQLEKRWSEDG